MGSARFGKWSKINSIVLIAGAAFSILCSSAQAASESPSGAAEVIAYVDKSVITIGEKVKYIVEVISEKDAEISFPAYTAQMGGFAVKDFGQEEPKKAGPNRVKRKSWYLLDTYTVGPYVIPPQPVVVKLSGGTVATLKSPEIFVEVKSLMEASGKDGKKEEGLHDIKSPLNLPSRLPVWMLGIFLLLILGAGGGLLWYFFIKRKHTKVSEPVRLPHEIALEELNRIEQMDLVAKRQIKEYYYLISNCLRKYLEDRFGVRAPEQTTEEFIESVTTSVIPAQAGIQSGPPLSRGRQILEGSALEGRFINLLKEYLNHCDLVKYAKLEPSADEIKKALDTTRRFIDETKPAPAAAVAEESEYDEEEVSA